MPSTIIIGRGFIGESIFRLLKSNRNEVHIFSHDEPWEQSAKDLDASLVLNAAAIVGQARCLELGKHQVLKANVDFAKQVADVADRIHAICVQLSTSGVYANPYSTPKREDASLSARNLYVESKILMEEKTRGHHVTILRLPSVTGNRVHPHDYVNRIERWEWVQDCYASILSLKRLASAIIAILHFQTIGDTYNIADQKWIHLPTHFQDHGHKAEVRSEVPTNFTQSHLLDTLKFERRFGCYTHLSQS